MRRKNIIRELERIFSRNGDLPLLLRGTATGYTLSIFRGFLAPLNELDAFLFWAVPETFDKYGIPIEKAETGVSNYEFAYRSSVDWAALHTTGYENGKLDDTSIEGLKRLETILQGKNGVVIGFNHQVSELGMFPEYTGEGHLVMTSEPVEIRYRKGIPLKYISCVEPIGELDKAILLTEYEKILGHKLTPIELAKTTLG